MAIKYLVQISDETAARLRQCKKVPGQMFIDLENEVIVFDAFGRGNRKKDLLVKTLEHGWIKESAARIKVLNSVPKRLGNARIIKVLERETKVVSEALIDREIINNI